MASSFGGSEAADLLFEAVNLEVIAAELLLLWRARFNRQQSKGGHDISSSLFMEQNNVLRNCMVFNIIISILFEDNNNSTYFYNAKNATFVSVILSSLKILFRAWRE